MTKFNDTYQAHLWRTHFFDEARRIVAGEVYRWVQRDGRDAYVQVYEGRSWFAREVARYPLHPAVDDMMRLYKPDAWQQLLL